eukprot:5824491-Pyramimonas_sp.AAC.1
MRHVRLWPPPPQEQIGSCARRQQERTVHDYYAGHPSAWPRPCCQARSRVHGGVAQDVDDRQQHQELSAQSVAHDSVSDAGHCHHAE